MTERVDTTRLKNRDVTRPGRLCVGDIVERVAWTYPDREAIVAAEEAAYAYEENDRLTYSELDDLANRIANAVLDMGVTSGDLVFTYCHNTTEYQAIQLGLAKTEAVAVVGNPMFPNDVLDYIIKDSGPVTAIVDSDLYQRDSDLFEANDLDPDLYIPTGGSLTKGRPLGEAVRESSNEEPEADIQPTDVFQIMYTSGTTGPAKGVMHSHLYMYTSASVHYMRQLQALPPLTDVVGSGFYPLPHIATQSQNMAGFIGQGTNVLLRSPDEEKIAAAVTEEGINVINVISPGMLRNLCELVESNPKEYQLDSLEFVLWGWGPLSPSVYERFQNLVDHHVLFAEGDGQTECVLDQTFWVDENQEKFEENAPGTNYFGKSAPLYATVPLDGDGNVMSPGEKGHYEKAMRSPGMMSGYFNKSEKTEEAFRDGWFRSGDAGYLDVDSTFVFTDRFKDVINSGGENVSSARVESAIMEHDGVQDAAVVGLPHERWQEAVTAFVVPDSDNQVSESEIIDYCRSDETPLADFEIPKAVEVIDEVPKTVGGKKQKHKIKEEYKNYY